MESPDQAQALENLHALDSEQVRALIDENLAHASRVRSSLADLHKLVEESLAVQNEVDTKIKLYQSLIAPIRRLPFEILGIIFVGYVEAAPHPSHHVISLVCRYWKHVLDHTPSSWSKISLYPNSQHILMTPEAILDRHLERSGRSPVAIEVTALLGGATVWVDFPALVNKIIKKASDRPWRTFSFDARSHERVPIQFTLPFIRHLSTSTSVEVMTKFHLAVCPQPWVTHVLSKEFKDTFLEAMTKAVALEELKMPHQILSPPHPVFKQLKHLTLFETLHNHSKPSVISVARECPMLESLTSNASISEPDFAVAAFVLPKLKYLCLEGCDMPISFFMRVRVPNLQTLVLKDRSPARGTDLLDGFESLMCQPTGIPPITKLVMDTPCPEKALIWFLEHLPTLEELHISNMGKLTEKTIEVLKKGPTTRRGWVCPKLKILDVKWCKRMRRVSLSTLIQVRREAAERPAPKTKTKNPERLLPPVALESVWFEGHEVQEGEGPDVGYEWDID